jgi:hypothetical protein
MEELLFDLWRTHVMIGWAAAAMIGEGKCAFDVLCMV